MIMFSPPQRTMLLDAARAVKSPGSRCGLFGRSDTKVMRKIAPFLWFNDQAERPREVRVCPCYPEVERQCMNRSERTLRGATLPPAIIRCRAAPTCTSHARMLEAVERRFPSCDSIILSNPPRG